MATRRFTPQQQEALKFKDVNNVLVSAGAGSGKTAVLTQRIFEIIESGVSLDEILVLTFTSKAAYEMKDRTKDLLSKNPATAHLADNVDSSNITTFDAYALSLVKKYGYMIGLSSNIDIIPESIFAIKLKKIIENLFKVYALKNDETFNDLIFNYCVKNDSNLQNTVVDICRCANTVLDKNQFFETYESKYMSDSFINNYIDIFYQKLKKSIIKARNLYLDLEDTSWSDEFEEKFFNPLYKNNYDALYNASVGSGYTFRRNNAKGDDKEILPQVLDILKKEVYGPMADVGSSKDIRESEEIMKKYNLLLIKLAKEASDELYEYKRKHEGYEFADIASLAYQIVNIPEVNKEIKNTVKYIMIDEYQDTNDLQEGFIGAISNNNVFMVGDVKQSIYRFRNSNPEIFVEKFNKYGKNDGGKLITFPDNFRSREGVISSINDTFEEIMTTDCGGVNYIDGHQLRFGNKYCYEECGKVSYDTSTSLCVYDEAENLSTSEVEINLVINDIKRKLNDGYKVYDFKKGMLRDCCKGDFAILVEKRTHYQEYVKAFNEAGIALKTDETSDAGTMPVVLVLRSILHLMKLIKDKAKPVQMEHDFCSIARSFICEMRDQTIYDTIKTNSINKSEIYFVARECANLINSNSLELLLLQILRSFGFVESLPHIGNVETNQAVLDQICSLTRVMDKLEFTFDDFVDFLSDLNEYEVKLEVDTAEDVDNSVNILTMHKSKGLEYPIVYLIGLAGKGKSDSASISGSIISTKYGIHIKDMFTQKRSLFQLLANKENQKESISEKMRLFYVALTRAKEKAILFMPSKLFDDGKNLVPSDCGNMAAFIKCYSNRELKKVYLEDVEYNEKETGKTKPMSYETKELNIESEPIYPKHASKELALGTDKKLLEFGIKLHQFMEIVDLKTKDTSFIIDEKERKLIDNALNSELFKDAENALPLHEYEFTDDINATNGIIDLLMIYDDHIDIIDFKLKHIDDAEYDIQLGVYENYVRTMSDKPINKYLLSLLDGSIREVK